MCSLTQILSPLDDDKSHLVLNLQVYIQTFLQKQKHEWVLQKDPTIRHMSGMLGQRRKVVEKIEGHK
uniref:Uncharacterized protein n=1 Tax=Rhizophora mucronata TaxID=61149 RepID=A0A2P2MXX6_RHIMU